MIESVEQTPFQQVEASTPGSLARSMLALLVREERRTWRELQREMAAHKDEKESMAVSLAAARWLESRNCAEKVRRILYGWEQ